MVDARCLVVLAPVTFLLLAEGALRLIGYGYPTTFFVAVAAGAPGELITNQEFACRFFSRGTPLRPFLFTLARQKPLNTIRICVLGESAAMGMPDSAYGFGRILQAELRRCHPGQNFELINVAMRGINSHVVCLIAQGVRRLPNRCVYRVRGQQ